MSRAPRRAAASFAGADGWSLRAARSSGPGAEYVFHDRLVMTLRQLKFVTLAAPLLVVAVLELARPVVLAHIALHERLTLDVILVLSILAFHFLIFRIIDDMQNRLRRHNEELLALHGAGLDVASELSLDVVLNKVVDVARELLNARYGALSVISDNGDIRSFITSGITPEQRTLLGAPPVGHGLLGVVLNEGQTLRTEDLTRDPRSIGFPAHHPAMKSLLAVPIPCKGPFRGNLYLTEKQGMQAFSADDEETLGRFAVQAAIAIDNAHLHERVAELAASEERMRIAHEMHDGLAQVLGYVNTKVQAANEYLKRGRTEEASGQLRELAASAREAYTDVREAIVGLRSLPGPNRSLSTVISEFLLQWQTQSGITAQLNIDESVTLKPAAELQVVRILQEALTNVRKHSRAQNVSVTFQRRAGMIVLDVVDDGVGFSTTARARGEFPKFGLTTMRERSSSVGAVLSITSSPGTGTTIHFELPAED